MLPWMLHCSPPSDGWEGIGQWEGYSDVKIVGGSEIIGNVKDESDEEKDTLYIWEQNEWEAV